MTDYTVQQLKDQFLTYFKNKGHSIIQSSSVVPHNDPSLLFTNSGMVQFKNILLGQDSSLKRACSIQRCIRAGGKHNDLDDVGKDNYHHTYFEMLGNWSFGDYGKQEAINMAWEFLVDILKLDPERLYVTYYEEMDTESHDIWKNKLPEYKIIASSKKDNFWEMGETGPCGPCTEIHYDRIGGRDASSLVNKDDPNVLEIWNLVFIEYNRTKSSLEPLQKKCVDTGIGFERLLSILNNVMSNYLTPAFTDIISRIESMTDYKYEDTSSTTDMAFRIVSDHCRTIAVCLHDGVEFSNEKQGYVMRRVMRRAIRYAHDVLGMKTGELGNLIRLLLVNTYEEDIEQKLEDEEICAKIDKLIDLVTQEEKLFLTTLRKGLERFRKMCKTSKLISSEEAFRMYDTYGFPLDLVKLLAEEYNIELDLSTYDRIKEEARKLSRKKECSVTEIIVKDVECTDDSDKYETNCIKSNLQLYIKDGIIHKASECDLAQVTDCKEIGVVFDKTCFYSECGGQVGDTGVIKFRDNDEQVGKVEVKECKKVTGFVIHYGILEGRLSLAGVLEYNDRSDIMRNHTATHLLNYTIRTFIKTQQKGSLVDKNKFRFDFEGCKIDLQAVERSVNLLISEKRDVFAKRISREDIVKEEGLIYMANEEYPDLVRMICVKDTDIKELCGGTHVTNTGDIYKMKIVSEGSISSNVRRIVGITGDEVRRAEERVVILERMIDDGAVVNIDKEIPLFDRMRLEEKVKANADKKKANKKENIAKNLQAFIWQTNVVREHNAHMNTLSEVKIENLDLLLKRSRKTKSEYEEGCQLKFEIVVFEYVVIECETKKEVFKALHSFVKRIDKDDDFLVWFIHEEMVHGYLRHYDIPRVKEIINVKCADSFVVEANGMLQFSFKSHMKDPLQAFRDCEMVH